MGILDDATQAVDKQLAKMNAEEAAREKAAKAAEQKIQAGINPNQQQNSLNT